MEILHDLTPQEKAALLYRNFQGEKTFKTAYLISHPGKKADDPGIDNAVSRWKNKPAVNAFLAEIQSKENARVKAELLNQERQNKNGSNTNGTEKGTEKGTLPADWHNFTNLEEFLAFCERQANLLNDEKDRQTYLKMIADLMRYKDQDKTGADIQRFYTPLQCVSCPLYQKEK